MDNILITGITGFVGSNIAKELLRRNNSNVIVGIHLDELSEQRLKHQGIDKGITWVRGSVEDYKFLERVINMYEITTVFHMSAVSIVRIASRNPLVTFRTNVEGTWNILEASRQSGTVKSFVGASSDKAYGDHAVLPYRETDTLNAVNTYDASKAMEDILIRTYAHNYGLNAVVTRSCNIYGPGDFNYSRIIPNSIRKLINNESPIIWKGVNKYVREFVYIDDLVSANLLLAEKAEEYKGEAFNIATKDIWQVESLINKLSSIMHKTIRASIVEKELEFLEIPEQYLAPDKISKTGWKPLYNFEDQGAQYTIDWYKKVFSEGVK